MDFVPTNLPDYSEDVIPGDDSATVARRDLVPKVYQHPIPIELIDLDAIKVLRRLSRHGYTAYLVGGGVRDLLLGRRPKDFDIATSARPGEVRSLFRNCRVIGRRFRLAHILFGGGKIIEVATFRRDPMETFDDAELRADELSSESEGVLRPELVRRQGRDDLDLLIRNDNVFGEPHEDALRRDFTINGLFYDLDREEVIDYVGGMPDLERRVVRTIGPPDVRFREDPVRILRAVKFSARLDMGLDPELYDAAVSQRFELARTARPRLLEELLRLMRGGASQRSIYICWDIGVLAEVLPELAHFLDDGAPETESVWRRLDVIDQLIAAGELPSDAVLLSALLYAPLLEALDGCEDIVGEFEDFFEDLSQRLAVPRRLKERVRTICLVQRRLSLGKLGALPRRDFFAEAAALYTLNARASDKPVPDWALDPVAVTTEPARRGRRGRRRFRPT